MQTIILVVTFILAMISIMHGCSAGFDDPLGLGSGEGGDATLFTLVLPIVIFAVGGALAVILPKIRDRRAASNGFKSDPLFKRIAETARKVNPTYVVITPKGVTLLDSPEAFMLSESGELTQLPQGRVKNVINLGSWNDDARGRFSNHIVSGDGTSLAYFDFEKEGYRTLNFEYLGYFAEALLEEVGGDYATLSCQLLTEDSDGYLTGARVTGRTISPTYSHDVTINQLFGCHFLVKRELVENVPTVEQTVAQCAPKSWF